jgi:hypothetical protein
MRQVVEKIAPCIHTFSGGKGVGAKVVVSQNFLCGTKQRPKELKQFFGGSTLPFFLGGMGMVNKI